MELFHKYKNKNFAFLTNYINRCINDETLALTPEELKALLSGPSQGTFEEFIPALTNNAKNPEDYDAMLLYQNKGVLQPIRQVPVPVRATIAEKAWLYSILQDEKSDLFLEPDLKKRLISALEKDTNPDDYPLKNGYMDIRSLSPKNKLPLSPDYVRRFKIIVAAIRTHRYLIITNHSFEGKTYEAQKIIPYKLEYSAQFDSFSLSCYPLTTKRPVKMNLKNISEVTLGEAVLDYDKFLEKYEQQIVDTREQEPVTIEITNKADAYDRCAYLFSAYDTRCYNLENDRLQMNIYYYRFQKDEIIRNILFLGPYVKVTAPKSVVEEVVEKIKKECEK